MVGLHVGRRGVGPCPACKASRRGSVDRRLPIGLRPDQRGWRCHACGAQGDGLDLAAWVVRGSRLRELDAEGCRAVVSALGAYETGDMPISADIGFPPLPSSRPHLDGLDATWAGAHPVTSDQGVARWLRGRGLDPERIADLDLARALHSEPPRWARCLGLGWLEGWRLLLPAYDAEGALRSLRGRWSSTSHPPEGVKAASPRGEGNASGVVLACALARQVFRLGEVPAWYSGERLQVIVCEGELDFLTWATRFGDQEGAPAVVGIWEGAWRQAHADRLPDGTQLVVLTDDDPGGWKFAEGVAETAGSRLEVRVREGRDVGA